MRVILLQNGQTRVGTGPSTMTATLRTIDRIPPVERMRWKFDTPAGREIYSRRMGAVEPVFGNLQNKGMRRFTLRGQRKVDTQWRLFTMVHNIEKIAGRAQAS